MNQLSLLALILTISGVYTGRLMGRIAPLNSEVPLKTWAATVCAGGLGAWLVVANPARPWQWLSGGLLIIAAAYIFSPYLLTALTRGGRDAISDRIVNTLYWGEYGQRSIKRLLAQAALRQGDASRALELVTFNPEQPINQQYADDPNSRLIAIQAFELQERWYDLVAIDPPPGGDNALLASAARVHAFAKMHDFGLADAELNALETRWQSSGEGAIGYRSLALARAYIFAARGNVAAVKESLPSDTIGVRELTVLADAAERNAQPNIAAQFYSQAYQRAGTAHKPILAAHLERLEHPLPALPQAKRPVATLALIGFLLVCYGVQVLIGRTIRPDAAQRMAGFILNVPIPDADAWWRYLSYGFVHGNLLHIGLNCWVLWDIGRLYEMRRFWPNIFISFALGTFFGAYLTVIAQAGDQLVLVGASGGVLGIAAALLADTLRSRNPGDQVLTRALVQWMLLIVVFSVAIPNVSLWGHLGGIVGGFLWGFIRQGLPKDKRVDQVAAGIAIGLMGYSLIEAGRWLAQHASML